MSHAARAAGVQIVTGDTKVVPRGRGDGIFINTAGVGVLEHDHVIAPASIRPGDVLLLSGDLGRHGMAVMSAREGLQFASEIQSDAASLWPVVESLLQARVRVHCLRDLTRGGLATALVELAETSHIPIEIDENAVPVLPAVQAPCELLGLDPFYVACEGRFVALVHPDDADRALHAVRVHDVAAAAAIIGGVRGARAGAVVARTALGTSRLVDMFSGEQLPRIC
jgi:hydrogenase expression/formation protein HypE